MKAAARSSIPQARALRSSPLTRPSSNRLLPPQYLRRAQSLRPSQCRTFLRLQRPSSSSSRAAENLNLHRMRKESYDYHIRRRNFLLSGAAAGFLATCYTAYLLSVELRKPKKFDSGGLPPDKLAPFKDEAGSKRKTVIHDGEGRELVPTGDSTVPTFPRLLTVDVFAPREGQGQDDQDQERVINGGVEYTLVGLGTRAVSMFGIRVYVVGFYVATQDVAAIQARLVREINPIASTLIPSEKEQLRRALLDPAEGERLWAEILGEVRPRSLFRIVPVRDTNFHHLRDGFVRAIQARSSSGPGGSDRFGDEAFGAAMREFKTAFNRGNVPKSKELLLCRDAAGELVITYDDGKKRGDGERGPARIGHVADERISRLLWLNYLAGAKVASEPARKNIVEGIMEFVERPIGTVATQVV